MSPICKLRGGGHRCSRYRDWPEARAPPGRDHGAVLRHQAGRSASRPTTPILQTYFIDYNVEDEEQKDCALGKLLTVVDQFSESACGKAPEAKPYLARIAQIKSSVKTTIITKRLQLSHGERGEGDAQGAGDVPVGAGRHRDRHRRRRPDADGQARREGRPPPPTGPSKISTELDAGLALDLIDVVNANPKDPGAPTALNNACVIYEKLFQFGEATKCYERLYKDYPDSEWGKEALWNSSRNHYRFFEFDQAVKGYLTVAQDPKFAESEHRKEALGLAASLLDNDQQYGRAADMYKKYSDDARRQAAGQRAGLLLRLQRLREGQGRQPSRSPASRTSSRSSTSSTAAGEYVVQAYMKLAVVAEATSKNKTEVLAAYKKVRDEFIDRKLPPATPAAGFAAKADFLIMEEKFKAFQKKELKFGSKPEQIKKTFDSFTNEAKQLQRGLPEDLELQGRHLDAGLVPAHAATSTTSSRRS